ncbi:hypothetical protein GBAR_LOCUS14026, partial [Geodia barretti]
MCSKSRTMWHQQPVLMMQALRDAKLASPANLKKFCRHLFRSSGEKSVYPLLKEQCLVRLIRPRPQKRVTWWTPGRMPSWPSWWRWGSGQRKPGRPSTNAGEMWRLHVSSWPPLLLQLPRLVVGVASSPLLSG